MTSAQHSASAASEDLFERDVERADPETDSLDEMSIRLEHDERGDGQTWACTGLRTPGVRGTYRKLDRVERHHRGT